jgi:hypothetical protein
MRLLVAGSNAARVIEILRLIGAVFDKYKACGNAFPVSNHCFDGNPSSAAYLTQAPSGCEHKGRAKLRR